MVENHLLLLFVSYIFVTKFCDDSVLFILLLKGSAREIPGTEIRSVLIKLLAQHQGFYPPRLRNWLAAMQMSESSAPKHSWDTRRRHKAARVCGCASEWSFGISLGRSERRCELSRVRWRAGRTGPEPSVEPRAPPRGEAAGVWPALWHLWVGGWVAAGPGRLPPVCGLLSPSIWP